MPGLPATSRLFIFLLFGAVGAVAGSVQAAPPHSAVGIGPITLSSSVVVTLREYLEHSCPVAMVVDSNGAASSRTFGTQENCPTVSTRHIDDLLKVCGASAASPPCRVLAVGRQIVWNGPVEFESGRWTPTGTDQKSVVLKVGGAEEGTIPAVQQKAVGIATFSADGRQAALVFQWNEQLGDCRGIIRRPVQPNLDDSVARFRISCSKAGAATGRLHFQTASRTGAGSGVGPNNRHFDLVVLGNERS